jgi:pimeloyl-ACP methyl ester carboxylesterase
MVERLPFDVRAQTTVHGLGLPGHDLRELNGCATYCIADHVSYIREYLASAQVRPALTGCDLANDRHGGDPARVVFVGHSYGSYLATRVLAEEPEVASRAHFVMLMPAMVEMSTCMPTLVRAITHPTVERVLVPLVSGISRLLPVAMRKRLAATARFDSASEMVLGRMMDGLLMTRR